VVGLDREPIYLGRMLEILVGIEEIAKRIASLALECVERCESI
jgi:hypothetical protein